VKFRSTAPSYDEDYVIELNQHVAGNQSLLHWLRLKSQVYEIPINGTVV
jgi:hypothetical protein